MRPSNSGHCRRLHFGIPRSELLIICIEYTNAGFLYRSEMLTTYVNSVTVYCVSNDVITRDTHTAEIPRLHKMLIHRSLPSGEHSEIWTWPGGCLLNSKMTKHRFYPELPLMAPHGEIKWQQISENRKDNRATVRFNRDNSRELSRKDIFVCFS